MNTLMTHPVLLVFISRNEDNVNRPCDKAPRGLIINSKVATQNQVNVKQKYPQLFSCHVKK